MPGRRLVLTILLWLAAGSFAAVVLALSWVPDSRLRKLEWVPDWLARWADSGGVMMTMRTGVALAVAGFLFTLTWRVSGWRRAAVAGMVLSVLLLLVAEGGQFFLPARSPAWGDVLWGSAGAALGVLVVAGIDAGRRLWRALRKPESPPAGGE
jgi:VanZ family protein